MTADLASIRATTAPQHLQEEFDIAEQHLRNAVPKYIFVPHETKSASDLADRDAMLAFPSNIIWFENNEEHTASHGPIVDPSTNYSGFHSAKPPVEENFNQLFWTTYGEQFKTDEENRLPKSLQQFLYRIDRNKMLQWFRKPPERQIVEPGILAEMLPASWGQTYGSVMSALSPATVATVLPSINESWFWSVEPPVEEALQQYFSTAHEEQFETGRESQFARSLQQLLHSTDPNKMLQLLRTKLEEKKASPEVLAEMLTWISRQDEIGLRDVIVDILSLGLSNAYPLVRDAAASGFAYFDEIIAINHLRRAIEEEDVPELRTDLEDLVRSLET